MTVGARSTKEAPAMVEPLAEPFPETSRKAFLLAGVSCP
jgi:hypothetical protein